MIRWFAVFLLLFDTLPCAAALPVYGYEIVHVFPHDSGAFTEGLFYRDGFLFESTGLEGRSSVRKVALESGEVLQSTQLSPSLFGEGIVDWGNDLIGLTWRNHVGFVADLTSFALLRQFSYQGEGWALTRNDSEIFMSDGSASLRVLDPKSLAEKRRIAVTAEGQPLDQLNELEWVKGEIFANIWQSDRIARIDPKSGHVVGWIDLTGLLATQGPVRGRPDVLNGIAYDAVRQRLFVTGKLWPWLFEIRVTRSATNSH
jgi:glutaminyl-peptide cyclotransferase